MNDIRVKIVETPRNPLGDVSTTVATANHHNEVDPLALDDTEAVAVADIVLAETKNEGNKSEEEVKKVSCDENAKERIEIVPVLTDNVKVLNDQCEKIKEELLKDDTSSIDSSIDETVKSNEKLNHGQSPGCIVTSVDTEDSAPDALVDQTTVVTSDKLEKGVENNGVSPQTDFNEDPPRPDGLETQIVSTTNEQVTEELSNTVEINTAQVDIPIKEDIEPKEVVKEVTAVNQVNSIKEVNKDTPEVEKVISSKIAAVVEEKTTVKEVTVVAEDKPTAQVLTVTGNNQEINNKIQQNIPQKEITKIPEAIPEKDIIKVNPPVPVPEKQEPNLKQVIPATQVAPIQKEPIREKSPIREVITLDSAASKLKENVDIKILERPSPSVSIKNSDVEMIDVPEKPPLDVKKPKVLEAAKREVQTVNGDVVKEEQSSKRRASEDAETDSPLKKLCQEVEKTFPQHDTMINEFIQTTAKHSIDEIQRHTEQLLSEIQTLRELAQKKEHEWNNILHLKKVKEEILLRLLRRKQVLSFEKSVEVQNGSSCKDPFDYLNQAKNLAIDKSDEISGLVLKQPTPPATLNNTPLIQPPMMQVPVTSHFNPMSGLPPPYDKAAHMQSMAKSVFPQSLMMPGPTMPFPRDMNGQMTNFGLPMGRQGPTKDVKSIIADYRQRNPDVTPRRGRRMKSILNPNMMNQPRQIAPKIENLNNLGMIFNNLDMNQKAMLERLSQMQATSLPNGMSFKDVLVQYANIQQQSAGLIPPTPGGRPEPMSHRPEPHQSRAEPPPRRRERAPPQPPPPPPPPAPAHDDLHISVKQNERLAASSPRLPPPPPYPEISLLPVNNAQEPGQQNSLLHGILTKQAPPSPQSYSPTLAKLLTSPERRQSAPSLPAFGQAKNCGEITITPVQPTPPPPPDPQPEKAEEVVQLDEDESPQSEGSAEGSPEGAGGRLVIDEAGAPPAENAETPMCQGCRRRDAQFVCAGCANQWYCSRDCQVAAWDEHSDMCSG